jgi:hypothetical protein
VCVRIINYNNGKHPRSSLPYLHVTALALHLPKLPALVALAAGVVLVVVAAILLLRCMQSTRPVTAIGVLSRGIVPSVSLKRGSVLRGHAADAAARTAAAMPTVGAVLASLVAAIAVEGAIPSPAGVTVGHSDSKRSPKRRRGATEDPTSGTCDTQATTRKAYGMRPTY